ncbi:hypothetical protein [Calditerrivibrio nitroreducens]|nr:hypothetical protein [Calditerrivibrio nitroreducens]
MPDYGIPYSEKDIWVHPRNRFYKTKGLKKDIVISKEKMKLLVKLLHDNNIKAIYYDEICSKLDQYKIYTPITYPTDYKYYSIPYFFNSYNLNRNKVISLYGKEYGDDANLFLIKETYIANLKKIVDEIKFDGIFLDSLGWLCEISSFGRTYKGTKIDKSPDSICSDFISEIKKVIGKDFLIFGNFGFYVDPDKVFSNTKKLIDYWVVEFPSLELIRKIEIYPKTFSDLNESFNSGFYDIVVYQPFFNMSNSETYEYLIAIAAINGVGIYHKNDYLGIKVLRETISKYNNFIFSNKQLFGGYKSCKEIVLNKHPDIPVNCIDIGKSLIINFLTVESSSYLWEPRTVHDKVEISLNESFCRKDITALNPENLDINISKKLYKNTCKIEIVFPESITWIILEVKK